MKTETYTLPYYWASALINGDFSGLWDHEEDHLNRWLAQRPELGACLSCSEEGGFRHKHDAHPEVLPCSCLDFVFPVTESAS